MKKKQSITWVSSEILAVFKNTTETIITPKYYRNHILSSHTAPKNMEINIYWRMFDIWQTTFLKAHTSPSFFDKYDDFKLVIFIGTPCTLALASLAASASAAIALCNCTGNLTSFLNKQYRRSSIFFLNRQIFLVPKIKP